MNQDEKDAYFEQQARAELEAEAAAFTTDADPEAYDWQIEFTKDEATDYTDGFRTLDEAISEARIIIMDGCYDMRIVALPYPSDDAKINEPGFGVS